MALTQTAFSQKLGVTQNYIHLLEKGVKKPSETLKLLLECVKEKAAFPEIKKEKGRRVKKNARNL